MILLQVDRRKRAAVCPSPNKNGTLWLSRAIFPHLENPRMTITDTFRELHGQGTLHGDIRLNNLLLDSSGAVYIIDFDRADVDVGEKQFKEEMDELADLLDNGDEENDGDKGNPHSI